MFNPGQMASQAAFRAALGAAGVYAHQKRGGRGQSRSSGGGGLRALGKLAVFALFVAGVVLNFVAWPLYSH
jgi:hypothetical protein